VRLLIRTDASPQIGGGHAVRCLALAEACGDAVFAMRAGGDLVQKQGWPVEPLDGDAPAALLDVLSRRGGDAAIVDSPFAGEPDVAALARQVPVLRLDDGGFAEASAARLVLNPNLGLTGADYPAMPPSSLLLGPAYCLLRRRFRDIAAGSKAARLFIGFGAADPVDFTGVALQALAALPGLEIVAVAGPANHHVGSLRAMVAGWPNLQLHVDPPDLPALLAGCSLALLPSSGMMWEAMLLGTPFIAVVIADNQRRNADWLAAHGIGCVLGWYADVTAAALAGAVTRAMVDSSWRDAMAARGREMVDGRGAERAVAALGAIVSETQH
jgi:UDP-2,4-diacetamido-2,4,6-trideoxy-beta-L-altropyranose hydrolase